MLNRELTERSANPHTGLTRGKRSTIEGASPSCLNLLPEAIYGYDSPLAGHADRGRISRSAHGAYARGARAGPAGAAATGPRRLRGGSGNDRSRDSERARSFEHAVGRRRPLA